MGEELNERKHNGLCMMKGMMEIDCNEKAGRCHVIARHIAVKYQM